MNWKLTKKKKQWSLVSIFKKWGIWLFLSLKNKMGHLKEKKEKKKGNKNEKNCSVQAYLCGWFWAKKILSHIQKM
jgi:hypothetical protein